MMRIVRFLSLLAVLVAASAVGLKESVSQEPESKSAIAAKEKSPFETLPGMQASGSMLLPNGWTINAQGKQASLGDFPVHLLVHPDGNNLIVLHCGYGEHEIITLDAKTLNKIARVPVPQSFYGLALSSDAQWIVASGGEDERVQQGLSR